MCIRYRVYKIEMMTKILYETIASVAYYDMSVCLCVQSTSVLVPVLSHPTNHHHKFALVLYHCVFACVKHSILNIYTKNSHVYGYVFVYIVEINECGGIPYTLPCFMYVYVCMCQCFLLSWKHVCDLIWTQSKFQMKEENKYTRKTKANENIMYQYFYILAAYINVYCTYTCVSH